MDIMFQIPKPQAGLDGCHIWEVEHTDIIRILALLRDHQEYKFKQLTDITAIDLSQSKKTSDPNKRFRLVYHLLSIQYNQRARVQCTLPDNIEMPSVTDLFKNANWYEREVWDMFGIPFRGHPDLRRILTDYGFEGHPLRKDFPLSGHTQVRFSESEERVIKEPVKLAQPYRNFDHVNPWSEDVLPGDEKSSLR